jgi:hypothetical protein
VGDDGPRSAQHRYQYGIADEEHPPMGDVPDGRRMVVGDHCWHVGEGPARSGQVERDPLFLAGEEHHVDEATAGEERVPADHGAARHEAQHGRPRRSRRDAERSGRHLGARGVEPLGPSYKHSCGQHGDPGVGVKHISSQSKRPGRPPRVVVGKGDVRRASPPSLPDVPVTFEPNKDYVRQVLTDQVGLRTDGLNYVDVDDLPADHRYFAYQGTVNEGGAPSEQVIDQARNQGAGEYRDETEGGHPIADLRPQHAS